MAMVIDPIEFKKEFWPHVNFYDRQEEIIYSIMDNEWTVVHAGNMLGKDYVAGFISLWFFLTRHPCRVVTTSCDGTQLEGVLWGEINRFIQECKYNLVWHPQKNPGGAIVANHLHLKKMIKIRGDQKEECGLSYMIGRVAKKGEGMLGHHIAKTGDGIPRTLFIADEASGVDNESIEKSQTWTERGLLIGNCYPPHPNCTYFKQAIKRGSIAVDVDEPALAPAEA